MEKKKHDQRKKDQGNFSIAILNFLKKKNKKIIVVSFRSRSYNIFDSILSAWGGVIKVNYLTVNFFNNRKISVNREKRIFFFIVIEIF